MSALQPQCVMCAHHEHDWAGWDTRDCYDAAKAHALSVKPCRRQDAVEGLLICRRDYERIEGHLREIPELYALALGEMQPGQGDGGRSSEVSIGIRISALDLRSGGDVLERLSTWERDWRETFHDDPVRAGTGRQQAMDRHARGRQDVPGTSLVGVVGYLLAGLHRAAAAHYAIDEFAADLATIHASAVAAARTGERTTWRVQCPADRVEGICGYWLHVTGEDFGDTVTCKRCLTTWDVQRLLRVVSSTREADVWLPAEEIALLIGVNERTLRKWAARGLVERKGGRYALDSVKAAIAQGATRQDGSA